MRQFLVQVHWYGRKSNGPPKPSQREGFTYTQASFSKCLHSLGYYFFRIRNTAGTALCPSLSDGLMVSFPFTSIQLLPPPSKFNASQQPRSCKIFASWVRVAPSAMPGNLP